MYTIYVQEEVASGQKQSYATHLDCRTIFKICFIDF